MGGQREKHWGLKATACAAIVVWQIYEIANASAFMPNDAGYLRYLVIGAALFGLIASLMKLTADY
jgi:hypothetical protein